MVHLLIIHQSFLLILQIIESEDGYHRFRRSLNENGNKDKQEFEDFFNLQKIRNFLKQQTNVTFQQEIKQILKEYFQEYPPIVPPQNPCNESKIKKKNFFKFK